MTTLPTHEPSSSNQTLAELTQALLLCARERRAEHALDLIARLRDLPADTPHELFLVSLLFLIEAYSRQPAVLREIAEFQVPAVSREELALSIDTTLDNLAHSSAECVRALAVAGAILRARTPLPRLARFRGERLSKLALSLGRAELGSEPARRRLVAHLFTGGGRERRALRVLAEHCACLREVFEPLRPRGRSPVFERIWKHMRTHPKSAVASLAAVALVFVASCRLLSTPEPTVPVQGDRNDSAASKDPSQLAFDENLRVSKCAQSKLNGIWQGGVLVVAELGPDTERVRAGVDRLLSGFKRKPRVTVRAMNDTRPYAVLPVPSRVDWLDADDLRSSLELAADSQVFIVNLEPIGPGQERLAIYQASDRTVIFLANGATPTPRRVPSVTDYVTRGKAAHHREQRRERDRYMRMARAVASDESTLIGVIYEWVAMIRREDVLAAEALWDRELAGRPYPFVRVATVTASAEVR